MRAEHEVTIDRPPADVFTLLTDLNRVPEWQSSLEELSLSSGAPLRVGSQLREVRTLLGRRVESSLEVTALEPAREFSLRVLSGPLPFHVKHRLEPVGAGTRLYVTGEAETGGFFSFAERLVERRARRQFERDFSAFKGLLER